MGSEQSSQSSKSQKVLRASSSKSKDQSKPQCSSPGPSISSDSDIPYVPYTVNRPIGDSPIHLSKTLGVQLSTNTPSPRTTPKAARPKSFAGTSSTHEIVVVKSAGLIPIESLDTDPDMINLQKIPIFQPIMRGALNLPTIQDPEVLSKLDHHPVLQLCQRYQEHLKHCAEVVSTEQTTLASRITEIDFAVSTLMNLLTERQKKFNRYCEQMNKMQEISIGLKRCQAGLSEVIRTLDTLNKMLPEEKQLEPFVMVTG